MVTRRPRAAPPAATAWPQWLVLGLTGVNLQAGLVATGPVAPLIRQGLGLTNAGMGLVLAIPPVAMGVAAIPGALLGRHLGPVRAMTLATLLLAAGSTLRAFAPHVLGLALATALMSLGAGLATATMPLLVAERFAADPGLATGIFTGGIAAGALLGAGVTAPILLPLSGALTWRGTFLFWGGLAAASWLLSTVLMRPAPVGLRARQPAEPPAGPGDAPRSPAWSAVLADRNTWLLAFLFGSQAALFFTLASWIPSLYTELGFAPAAASLPLLVLSITQLPGASLLPLLVGRTGRPRTGMLAALAVTALGLGGLALAPAGAPWLWGGALGFGVGGLFGVCMMLPVTLFPAGQVPGATGLMLTLGYGTAAAGPLLMGAVRDLSASFGAGLLAALALTGPMALAILALPAGPAGTVIRAKT